MPVPATTDWTLDTGEVIEAAQRRLRKPRDVAVDLDIARDGLQFTFSKLQSVGINMWTMRLDTLAVGAGGVALPATLPSDVVDVLSMVYSVPAEAQRQDTPVTRIDAHDWLALPQKDVAGPPRQFFIDRQRDACILHLDTVPDAPYLLTYWVVRRFKDIGNMLEHLDVPVHWLGLVTAGVAYYIGMCTPDLTEEHRAELKNCWADEYGIITVENRDRSVFRVQPDLRYYTGAS